MTRDLLEKGGRDVPPQTRDRINTTTRDGLDALKPPSIPLMGELANPKIQETIQQVAGCFDINTEQLVALIQRESGGNPLARSTQGSRGFMQITGSLFQDMYRIPERNPDGSTRYIGRGVSEYLDDFQQISPSLLGNLRPKYGAFVSTIEEIQCLGPKDQRKFSLCARKLQTQTYTSTALGEIEPNLLIGALYLSSIDDRSENFLDNPKNSQRIQSIIRQLRGVNLSIINGMLTSKGFSPISGQKELLAVIDRIVGDKSRFQTFITNYNYNGDKKRDADGTEHRVNFGLAVSISEEQLRTRNQLSA